MKLSALGISNLLVARDVALDLSKPLTFVCGKHGAGKSTVASALKLALTGACEHTTKDGKGSAALVSHGAPGWRVNLGLASGTKIARSWSGSASVELQHGKTGEIISGAAADAMISGAVGSIAALGAVLDMARWTRATQDEKTEILQTVLGLTFAGDHWAQIVEMQCPPPARPLIARPDSDVSIDWMTAEYDRLYKNRTAAKKLRDDAKAKLPAALPMAVAMPTEADLTISRGRIADAETRLQGIREEGAEAGAQVKALEELRHERAVIASQLAAIVPAAALKKAKQSDFQVGPSWNERKAALEEAIGAADQAQGIAKETLERAIAEEAQVAGIARGLGETIASIEAGNVVCDGRCGAYGAPCPALESAHEESVAALPGMRKQFAGADAAASEASLSIVRAREAWQFACKATGEARAALQTAQLATARTEGADEERRSLLTRQLASLDVRIEKAGEPETRKQALLIEYRTAETALRTAQADLKTQEELLARVAQRRGAEANLAELEAQAEALEAAVAWLDPKKGVATPLIAEKSEPFLAKVNATLARIAPYSVRLTTAKGLGLEFVPIGETEPRTILSESEWFRVGISLAASVSIATEIRILVIDRVDMLLEDVRGELLDLLGELAGEIETCIVLAARSEPLASGESYSSYWLENGTARLVEAESAAVAS